MSLRLLPVTLFAALLTFGIAAPQIAYAAPIDLGDDDDEDEDEEEDDPLFEDEDTLGGGSVNYDRKKKRRGDDEDDMLIDDEFEEPEEFFEHIPDDEEAFAGEPLGDFDGLEDAPSPGAVERPRRGAHKGPGPIELDVAGKTPMGDNYPIEVIAVDRDAVVVELPLLLARSRVEVEDGFLVYAEVWVGGDRVSEVRQVVERNSVAEFGPSFAFLKVLAPVVEREGQVKIRVFRANLDGSDRTEVFSRVTPYSLQ